MAKNKYKSAEMLFKELKGNVTVPKYQRKLVWRESEKIEFIHSLAQGYPFGSILLYQFDDYRQPAKEQKNTIVDGLQRYTTLLDYGNRPGHYWSADTAATYEDKLINGIEQILNEELNSNQLRFVNDWFKKLVNDNNRHDPKHVIELKTAPVFSDEQQTKLLMLTTDLPIENTINDVDEAIANFIDLDNVKIPVIYFTGDESELPTVFENLNRGGTKLSKYQVFAASWTNYPVKLNSGSASNKFGTDKVLNANIDRYEHLDEEREIEIIDYNRAEYKLKRTVNLSEFAFGLGTVICTNIPSLFQVSKDTNTLKEDVVNEIGYGALGIITGYKNNEINKISRQVKFIEDNQDLILKGSLEISKDINQIFEPILRKPVKTSDTVERVEYETGVITDFKALSYFAALWSIKFSISDDQKLIMNSGSETDTLVNKTMENIPAYCIFDTLNDNWRGSGDSRLNRFYKTRSSREAEDSEVSSDFLHKISKDRFEAAVSTYIDADLSSPSINFKPITKSLAVIVANKIYGSFLQSGFSYEFEHVVAKDYLSSKYSSSSIPAGSLGNVMLLEARGNRGKKEDNLWKHAEEDSTSLEARLVSDQAFLNKLHYPDKQEFDTVLEAIEQNNFEPVKSLIRKREGAILSDLVKLYSTNK